MKKKPGKAPPFGPKNQKNIGKNPPKKKTFGPFPTKKGKKNPCFKGKKKAKNNMGFAPQNKNWPPKTKKKFHKLAKKKPKEKKKRAPKFLPKTLAPHLFGFF